MFPFLWLSLLMASPAQSDFMIPGPRSKPVPGIAKEYFDQSRISKTDALMDLLNIRPGTVILDVGAGPYVLEFANRLKGTGTVFATATSSEKIASLEKEAAERSLSNLHPVLVKPGLVTKDGLDAFYAGQRYDVVLLSEVSVFDKPDPAAFRQIRESLNKDGKLVVIIFERIIPFSRNSFSDFRGLLKELALDLPANQPFRDGLRQSTQDLMKKQSGGEPDAELQAALVSDFNRMLRDRHFCSHFLRADIVDSFKKEVSFSADEKDFALWLVRKLKENGIFKEPLKDTGLIETHGSALRKLNKLLIVQRFRPYLNKGGMDSQAPDFLQTLHDAGYRLEKEDHDSIPLSIVLIFSKA